jgi:hypothetical protein
MEYNYDEGAEYLKPFKQECHQKYTEGEIKLKSVIRLFLIGGVENRGI